MDKTNKNKFKLEDLQKEHVFDVPDDYFEKLPLHIQKRIEKKPSWLSVYSLRWVYGMKYALPVVLLVVLSVIYLTRNTESVAPEELIAQVQTEDILHYLQNDVDISSYEILDELEANNLSIDLSEDPLKEIDELQIDESLYDDIIVEEEFMIN